MTVLHQTPDPEWPGHARFRITVLFLAALFGLQCLWLLSAELIQPRIPGLPINLSTAMTVAKKRTAATVSASIGVVRGDLWSESAYTYAELLWPGDAKLDFRTSELLARARKNLDRALRWGPLQSGAWLFLAGLSQQFRLAGVASVEALKMSYYTGPSELPLVALRLSIAVRTDEFDDFEIRQFVSRDIRSLLVQDEKIIITQAYRTASPAGRSFMEQAIRDIDPSALSSLRTSAREQPLPD
jgi:hypothetical protein